MFRVGDKVNLIDNKNFNSIPVGKQGTIIESGIGINTVDFGYGTYQSVYNSQLALTNENKTMNIKEKFILAITPEPKKSFRKVSITDGDDVLTEEGTKVFLTWLLHNKYAEEFKTDVVDGILKEEKCEKKEEEKE